MTLRMSDPDLMFVWDLDDIDSSFYTDEFDPPRPLHVCLLFYGQEIVESLGGIDVDEHDPYAREVERELLDEFEARREANIIRSVN
jgi:hypothetical protein